MVQREGRSGLQEFKIKWDVNNHLDGFRAVRGKIIQMKEVWW